MNITFRENVFVSEDFVNRKENELHRKYKGFGGSTENASHPILEIYQN